MKIPLKPKEEMYWKYIVTVLALFTGGGLVSCDECDDCFFSENDPYINLRFLDSTSYNSLTGELVFLNDTIGTLDSLAANAEDSVDAGNTAYEADLIYFTDLSDSFGTIRTATSGVRSEIANGSFFPERIIPVGGGAYPDPPVDSINVLQLPLDMGPEAVTEYYLQINGRTDTLTLGYRTVLTEKNSEYFLLALDPEVLESSFPGGTRIACADQDSCITDNATVYVYY